MTSATSRRVAFTRFLLWIGAIAPFLIATSQKTLTQASNVGALDVVRGIAPLACFLLSLMLVPRGTARKFRFGWVEVGLVWYLVVILLSSFWSIDPKSTALKALVLTTCYLCVWRMALLYESPRKVIDGAAAVAYWMIAATAAEFVFLHADAYTQVGYGPYAPDRLSTVYPQIGSNVLAWVCGFAAVAAIFKIGPSKVMTRRWRAALIVSSVGEALLSSTRLAPAVWIGVLLVVVLLRGRRSPFGLLAALVIGVGGGSYLYSHQATIETLLTRGQSLDALSTLTGRTIIWDAALALWHTREWVGFGYYSGHRFLLGSESAAAALVQDIDSTWIETLLDVGILGTFGLGLFALAGVFRCVATTSLSRDHHAFAVTTVLATLAISFVNPSIQTTIATGVLTAAVILAVPPRARSDRAVVHNECGLSAEPSSRTRAAMAGGPGQTAASR